MRIGRRHFAGGTVIEECCLSISVCLLVVAGCGSSEIVMSDVAADATVVRSEDATIPSQSPRVLGSSSGSVDDWFLDVTKQLGLESTYSDGSSGGCYQLLESVGGGVGCIDYDRDGWVDLFFPGGGILSSSSQGIAVSGSPNALYANRFSEEFENVSLQAGLSDSSIFTHGCTAADIDSDGFSDLIVAGYQGVQVWINNGDGTFQEQARELGIQSKRWNVTACAADYDGDQMVDIYLLTYADWTPDPDRRCTNDNGLRDICGPTLFSGSQDLLFNNQQGMFVDATDEVGLVAANRGLGIVAADLDANGTIDFAVVNDVEENQLYMNSGSTRFDERGQLLGIAYSDTGEREGSMGIDLGDYNSDGFPDLWYTNYSHQDNALLRNVQGNGFVHSAGLLGLQGGSRQWVGFGTTFCDFDHDGWDDLFVLNGHVAYERLDSPYYQPAQLFKNRDGERFEELASRAGAYFAVHRAGRGAATVDFDNDGALDLVCVHQNEPAALLKNQNKATAWLQLELVGTLSERSAVGAKATIHFGDRKLSRWVIGGGSYLSHSDPRLLFPLKNVESVSVVVTWLGGATETFANLDPNRCHVLVQGRGVDALQLY